MDIELPISIRRQPDYTTCGPTSLHAVYQCFQDPISLEQVIAEVPKNPEGGTLAVHLALHALRRGYDANISVFNVSVWDPTWFREGVDLFAKVRARFEAKGTASDPKIASALRSFEEFLELGGRYRWQDLTPRYIGAILRRGLPILCGVNATYLYQCAREKDDKVDDVAGDPFGHFLVVCGYHSGKHTVSIADPLQDNPLHGSKYYEVGLYRFIGSVFLGAATDDANFLIIQPRRPKRSAKTKPA
jgi:hypothetical protein